ncbi:MAG: cation transporter [Planctomycetes bacterium]|nr:cation transporter [Planctomycetota bacterium]
MTPPVEQPDTRPSPVAAALFSFVVAVVLLAAKFWAYWLTGSQAIFSDALESIVNVLAAMVAVAVLRFAGRPADRDHPFGHGKLEFFSAAFEGGLICCAALLILWQAGEALLHGHRPEQLDLGLLITVAAGAVNGVVGVALVRFGTKHHSAAIVADGHHLLSDFWTSAGVIVGLLLVWLTGAAWLDPAVAIAMVGWLLVMGWRIVSRAIGGLMDAEDPQLLRDVVEVLGARVGDGVIRVHNLRAIRAGSFRHISAHLVVPEFWSVQRAHDLAEQLATEVMRDLPGDGDIDFHTDPCERAWCTMCDLQSCSVRRQPFVRLEPLTVDEAVEPDHLVRPLALDDQAK